MTRVSFRVERETIGEAEVLRLYGDVDVVTTPVVVDAIGAAIRRGGVRVVLDCLGVEFMDSKMVEAIFTGAKHLRDVGGDMAVACANSEVLRTLQVLGVDAVVAIRPTVEEALGSFGVPPLPGPESAGL